MGEAYEEAEKGYEPPESLWQFVRSLADQKELDVIKSVIGESLVETSLDLHNEIDTLLEIWRDYRNETMIGLDKLRRDRISVTQTAKIAEPANVRDTLKSEIRMYVEQLQEHFRHDETKFRRQIVANQHNVRVINYVMNASGPSESLYDVRDGGQDRLKRPKSTVRSRTGSETPVVTSSGRRSSRRCQSTVRYRSHSVLSSSRTTDSRAMRVQSVSPSSSCAPTPVPGSDHQPKTSNGFDEQVEFLVDEDKLNCLQIDDIVENLREMLRKGIKPVYSSLKYTIP